MQRPRIQRPILGLLIKAILEPDRESQQYTGTALGRLRARPETSDFSGMSHIFGESYS